MNRYILYFAAILAAGSGMRCKPTEPVKPESKEATMVLMVQPQVNGQAFSLNNKVQGSNSLKFDMSVFRTYLSNIRLVKEDNTEEKVLDVALIDMTTSSTVPSDPNTVGTKFTIKVPVGNYKGIKMGLGVNKDLNVVKQNYPNTHPLSVYRGMDWDWAGYRFIMLKGSSGDNSTPFEYHIMTDTFYREMNFANSLTFSGDETKTIKLNIDVDKIFNPADQANKIDPAVDQFTHSETKEQLELSRRVTDNMKSAISLQ
jgi:hypothetical protein